MADNQEWYYSKGEQKLGPVSPSELKQLANTGALNTTDLIWKSEWTDWRKAESLKGLFPVNVQPAAPRSIPPRNTAESIRAASEAAEQVSKKFWFLDLKFEQFATPKLVGFIFASSLLFLLLGGIGASVYLLLFTPILAAVFGVIGIFVFVMFYAVMIRVTLEVFLVSFRIAEHLSHLRHLERLGVSN